jgi:hypothetical protein
LDTTKASRSTRFPAGSIFFGTLLVCAAILVIPWQRAREQCRTSGCVSHLYGIGDALRVYHATHGTYPPSPDEPATGDPAVSWRVLIILPSNPDLNRYDLGQPWYSPHNEQFIRAAEGRLFSCPGDFATEGAGMASYLAVVGKGTVWCEVRLGHIRCPDKEVPKKIVAIEVPHSGVYWTEPRDISADEAIMLFRLENGLTNGRHRTGLHYLTAEGTVHTFNEIGSVEEFASLLRTDD